MFFSPSDHTFIVCAYGENEYLEACIQSLMAQTALGNIIISTATPNSYIQNIAQIYGLEVYVNTGEKGIAGDWNYAMSIANTPLYTLAHQDDVYEPTYLETVIRKINENDDTLICFSDYFEIHNERRISSKEFRNLRMKETLLIPLRNKSLQKNIWVRRRILSLGNVICCPSVTYVRSKIPIGLFLPQYTSNLDWQAWEQLSRSSGRFLYVHEALMGHRVHGQSTSALVQRKKGGRKIEDLEMLRMFWPAPIARIINCLYSRSITSRNGFIDKTQS